MKVIWKFLTTLIKGTVITALFLGLLATTILFTFFAFFNYAREVTVICISLTLLVTSMVGAVFFQENKPAAQMPRWIFYIAFLVFIGSLTYWVTGLILQTGAPEFTGIWSTALKFVISISLLRFVVEETYKSFLLRLGANEFGAANDLIFGKTGSTGMKIYRIFFGGLKAKFPWESLEIVDDLNKDIIILWSFIAEFLDATGKVSGTLSLRPDKNGLQQYLGISKDADERKDILVKVFTAVIKMILGDYLRTEKIKDAMGNKRTICEKVDELGGEQIDRTTKNYGVLRNTLIVADIDYTEEVKNSFEQKAVNDNLMEAAAIYLRAIGYTNAQIKGEDPTKPVSLEHLRWATDMVKETAQEIKRTIFDIRGLENAGSAGTVFAGLMAQDAQKGAQKKGGKKR
jgi:hypothetical protein